MSEEITEKQEKNLKKDSYFINKKRKRQKKKTPFTQKIQTRF